MQHNTNAGHIALIVENVELAMGKVADNRPRADRVRRGIIAPSKLDVWLACGCLLEALSLTHSQLDTIVSADFLRHGALNFHEVVRCGIDNDETLNGFQGCRKNTPLAPVVQLDCPALQKLAVVSFGYVHLLLLRRRLFIHQLLQLRAMGSRNSGTEPTYGCAVEVIPVDMLTIDAVRAISGLENIQLVPKRVDGFACLSHLIAESSDQFRYRGVWVGGLL